MSLTDSEQRFWDDHCGLPRTEIDLESLLQSVHSVLQPGLHPGTVSGFLATPQPDLEYEGRAVGPTQWQLLGGPVEPVLTLAKELGDCI
ncbi:hypothetical protein [Paeniglutamicibacter sp.]|uniref:hypothetical protein n=1 Tax=Paeniglutamicibacter sp. TaxID=1934391 RepID=UPI003988DB2A